MSMTGNNPRLSVSGDLATLFVALIAGGEHALLASANALISDNTGDPEIEAGQRLMATANAIGEGLIIGAPIEGKRQARISLDSLDRAADQLLGFNCIRDEIKPKDWNLWLPPMVQSLKLEISSNE